MTHLLARKYLNHSMIHYNTNNTGNPVECQRNYADAIEKQQSGRTSTELKS